MREKLMFQNAPHVRQSESVLTIMTDVVIALVPLYIMSFFYYGVRALVLGLCGVASCLVFSAVGSLVSKERPNIRDLTSAITGLIIPLLMPADVPYYVILAACAVAILVVKLPFGGTGYNLFNPAAVGFASVALCWPELGRGYSGALLKRETKRRQQVRRIALPSALCRNTMCLTCCLAVRRVPWARRTFL